MPAKVKALRNEELQAFIVKGAKPLAALLLCLLQEVLNMLKESKADIFVDPVLHTACALDIKHQCAAIPPGKGRRESTLRLAAACVRVPSHLRLSSPQRCPA